MTFSISMYIICVISCLFSALSRKVGTLQISIIIIIITIMILLLLLLVIIIIPFALVSRCKYTRYVDAFGIASGMLQERR